MNIIHIVENLDRGAVENWLVNVFIESRRIRPDWKWTFFCILGKEGRLDRKVRDAGGTIIYSPVTISNKISFLKHLRKTLQSGRYDILHAHHDYLSGFYLLASAGIKFKKRLLQIHNTDKALPVGNKTLHQLLLKPFQKLGLFYSDLIVGISENTLEEYSGKAATQKGRYRLLYYGVDFSRFADEPPKAYLNEQFSLPAGSKTLLYAGRMNDLKNPEFVIDVLSELLKKRQDVYALFIGSGDKETAVREKASRLGLEKHVRVVGWHNNVPKAMKSADVFVFPRKEYPKEGLGLVVVEAQAAGLPFFITNGIVHDAVIVNELAHFNDLSDPAKWALQIDKILNNPPAISRERALQKMNASHFELSNATKNLIALYES